MGYFGKELTCFPTFGEINRLVKKKDTRGLVRAIGRMEGRQSTGRGVEKLATMKLRELITAHDRWAVEPLIKAARDESCGRHYNILMALSRIKDDRVFAVLVEMSHNADLRIKKSAIQALGELQDERAVEPLVSLCDDSVRERVVEALTRIGSDRALEALRILLQEERVAPDTERKRTENKAYMGRGKQ